MASAVDGVGSSTSTSTTSTTSTDATSASLNYNNFLQLFMTELQNQDPTNPMDTTEQMSQLATFSSVEQQIKTNTNLSSLISQSMIGQAGSLIGKTVTDSSGATGVVKSISVATDSSTSALTLTATLASGKTMTIGSGVTISDTSTTTTN